MEPDTFNYMLDATGLVPKWSRSLLIRYGFYSSQMKKFTLTVSFSALFEFIFRLYKINHAKDYFNFIKFYFKVSISSCNEKAIIENANPNRIVKKKKKKKTIENF